MIIVGTVTSIIDFLVHRISFATRVVQQTRGDMIYAACSGFLYALVTGQQFVESGRYKK